MKGEFRARPHNPAFEVLFVYIEKEGALDLNFRGAWKAVEPLQGAFAKAILKIDDLPPDSKDERVYDLNPLRSPDFEFVYGSESGIQSAAIKKIRFSSRIVRGDRVTLEANPIQNEKAIYDLLDKIEEAIPFNLYDVTQVEIRTTVSTAPETPAKVLNFSITHPNSCSLKYDDVHLRLRAMLEDSGIEPREQNEAEVIEV